MADEGIGALRGGANLGGDDGRRFALDPFDGEALLGEEAFLVGDKFWQSLEWRGAFELQDLHG
jgi:hypothetical protein